MFEALLESISPYTLFAGVPVSIARTKQILMGQFNYWFLLMKFMIGRKTSLSQFTALQKKTHRMSGEFLINQ